MQNRLWMFPSRRALCQLGDTLTSLSLILILLQSTPFSRNVQLVIHLNSNLSLKLFVYVMESITDQ